MSTKKSKKIERNVPDWVDNPNDYCLLFMDVMNSETGLFECREVGHNLREFNNILFSDYLNHIGIGSIPDYTQFMRILAPDYILEFRHSGGRIRIDYTKREFIESRY